MKQIHLEKFSIGKGQPLTILSGPCVIESEEHCLQAAETLKKICKRHQVNLVFKSSYDKANRSSFHSFRGPGLQKGLQILERVKKELGLPILTDVHTEQEAKAAGSICDMIQIPAFLCRQTDLIVAAARTGAIINVKKGQFLSPWEMGNIVEKIEEAGNQQIILVERGTSFGYNQLISDMRAIAIMQEYGYPVCFDATHSVQKPGALGKTTGGDRRFIATLTKAALAAGANALFIEAHPFPSKAKSDAASVFSFAELDFYLPIFKQLYEMMQISPSYNYNE